MDVHLRCNLSGCPAAVRLVFERTVRIPVCCLLGAGQSSTKVCHARPLQSNSDLGSRDEECRETQQECSRVGHGGFVCSTGGSFVFTDPPSPLVTELLGLHTTHYTEKHHEQAYLLACCMHFGLDRRICGGKSVGEIHEH